MFKTANATLEHDSRISFIAEFLPQLNFWQILLELTPEEIFQFSKGPISASAHSSTLIISVGTTQRVQLAVPITLRDGVKFIHSFFILFFEEIISYDKIRK